MALMRASVSKLRVPHIDTASVIRVYIAGNMLRYLFFLVTGSVMTAPGLAVWLSGLVGAQCLAVRLIRNGLDPRPTRAPRRKGVVFVHYTDGQFALSAKSSHTEVEYLTVDLCAPPCLRTRERLKLNGLLVATRRLARPPNRVLSVVIARTPAEGLAPKARLNVSKDVHP